MMVHVCLLLSKVIKLDTLNTHSCLYVITPR